MRGVGTAQFVFIPDHRTGLLPLRARAKMSGRVAIRIHARTLTVCLPANRSHRDGEMKLHRGALGSDELEIAEPRVVRELALG